MPRKNGKRNSLLWRRVNRLEDEVDKVVGVNGWLILNINREPDIHIKIVKLCEFG